MPEKNMYFNKKEIRMKRKYITLTTLIIAFLGMISCEDILNVKQESYITSTEMWLSEEDAEAGMYGMYNRFRNAFSENYAYYGDYRSSLYGNGIIDETNFVYMFNNTLTINTSGTNWVNFYTAINDANLLLKHTPDITFGNDVKKNAVLANGYFVRAYTYFWLVRVFGDVPLVTEGFESDEQDLYPARTPASEVYAQIEADIIMADNLMPEGIDSRIIANKAAVKMLMTDYYLWMAKTQGGGTDALTKAKTSVNAVLGMSSSLELQPDFSSVFYSEKNNEIILALDFNNTEFTGGYPSVYLVPTQYLTDKSYVENPVRVGSHQEYVCVTEAYQNFLYSVPTDQRAWTSCAYFTDNVNNESFRWINKYPGSWTDETRYFNSDIVLYRFAEALMFRAEIENALGFSDIAVGYLNDIAERAYGIEDYYPASFSQEEVNDALIDEYKKEFVAEGKSWWVFQRFGVVYDMVTSLVGRENEHANMLLWPLATATLSGNSNLVQTEGY